jgi:hypothetical protein
MANFWENDPVVRQPQQQQGQKQFWQNDPIVEQPKPMNPVEGFFRQAEIPLDKIFQAFNESGVSFNTSSGDITKYIGQKAKQIGAVDHTDTWDKFSDHIWSSAADRYQKNADYWKKRQEEAGGANTLNELVGTAIGEAPAGVMDFYLGKIYAMTKGAAEAKKQNKSEIMGALSGLITRYGMGKVMTEVAPYNKGVKALVNSLMFAGPTAIQGGDKKEIAKSVGAGLMFAGIGEGGNLGFGDLGGKDTPQTPQKTPTIAQDASKEPTPTQTTPKRDLSKVDLSGAPTGKAELLASQLKMKQEDIIKRPIIQDAVESGKMNPEDVDMVRPYKGEEWADKFISEVEGKKDLSQLSPPIQEGESIKSAAIKMPDGEIVTGQYHQEAYDKLGMLQEDSPPGVKEGFVTDKGRFVSREEASKISKESGQLESPPKSLHSEDLGAEIKPPMAGQPPKEPPKAPAFASEGDKGDFENLKKKVADELGTAKKLTPEVIKAQKAEKSKRTTVMRQIRKEKYTKTGKAEEAIKKSTGALRGELTQYDKLYPPVRDKLGGRDEELFADILNNPKCSKREQDFYILNCQDALTKLLDGHYMTRGDAILIENQFGKEMAKAAKSRMSPYEQRIDKVVNFMGGLKTMTQLFNIHFFGRQAAILGAGDWGLYAKSFPEFAKSYFSEEHAQSLKKEYEADPLHDIAIDAGVQFPTEPGEIHTGKEDEPMPTKANIPFARASQRAFTVAGNWFRQQFFNKVYNSMVEQARNGGPELTDERVAELGKIINSFSGRSNTIEQVRALKKATEFLSLVMYSPRMTLSRWESLFHAAKSTALVGKDVVLGKQIRAEHAFAAKSFASFVGSRILLMSLAKLAFGDKVGVETDIRSGDFGKIKVGGTRIDLFAGMLQPVRLTALMLLGQRKDEKGKLKAYPRKSALWSYITGRESPALQELSDWSEPTGELKKWYDKMGVPPVVRVALRKMWQVSPIPFQEIGSSAVADGWPTMLLTSLMAGAAASVGVSAYGYEPTERVAKQKMSTWQAVKYFFTGNKPSSSSKYLNK